jgi:capsular polysaccharide biosynthesis protein
VNNSSARPPHVSAAPPPANYGAAPPPANEPTTRERVARIKTLVRRGFGYWKMALLLFVLGCAGAVGFATTVKRTYRSEATILVKPSIKTDSAEESSEARGAKLTERLKNMLTTRSNLEAAIRKFKLYPAAMDSKPAHEVADDMKAHVGFRALDAGRYVVSFEGDDQETVQKVTAWLADSLISEFTTGDLKDTERQAEVLGAEEKKALEELETATKSLTEFLAKHPEFALEAKNSVTPFGQSPALSGGIPLMPGISGKHTQPAAPKADPVDPALAAIYRNDPTLQALYRQKARLEEELKAMQTPAPAPAPAPTSTAQAAARAAQIEAAQGEVEAATKTVAERQADLAGKRTQLTDEHPDVKTARAAADQAARALTVAKQKLAALQSANTPASPQALDNAQAVNPELVAKIRELNGQLNNREAELRKSFKAGTPPPAPAPVASGAGTSTAPALPAVEPMSPVVALETDWQSRLRRLSLAKARHESISKNAEAARLRMAALKATASENMSIVEPAYKPMKPSKGGRANAAMMGIALAFLIAVLYATARVAFNDRLIDAQDVEALKIIPVLGVIPKIPAPRMSGSKSQKAEGAHVT